MLLELTRPDVVDALRRVAGRSVRGPRYAAYALEVCQGDEDAAAALLMDPKRVAMAEQSLEIVRAYPERPQLIRRWEDELDRRTQLLANRPRDVALIGEITSWMFDRLGLVRDESSDARAARKVGRRPAFVGFAATPKLPPRETADRLALAHDLFPIGVGWHVFDPAIVEAELAFAIHTDLAYGTEVVAPASARSRASRFVRACGANATFLCNSTPQLDAQGRRGSRGWNALTQFTFDWGLAVIGETRSGICAFAAED